MTQMTNGMNDRILSDMETEHKVFKDVVHGSIELHPLCVKFVDTPQFQRLRNLKQLGITYWVYPSASHNRFEHSLGVSHLAGQYCKELKARQPEFHIDDKDVLCVALAGLCHDLGHGPFSHLFEVFMKKKNPELQWLHETTSVQMFDYIIEENNLMEDCKKYGLEENDLIFIKELIRGSTVQSHENWPYRGRPKSKAFLYQIVANKQTGVDVDKWDYILRDGCSLGMQMMFDHTRLQKFTRIIDVPNEGLQICVRDKEINNLHDLFHARKTLHRTAYQHKVVQILEIMLIDAMLLADEYLCFYGKNNIPYTLSEAVKDLEAFTDVTDDVLYLIRRLKPADPCVIKAKETLHNILTRNLYPYIGHFKINSNEKSQLWLDQLVKKMPLDLKAKHEDFVIGRCCVNYGMGAQNPIEKVNFYSKENPNVCRKMPSHETSQLLPTVFQEIIFRVLSRRYDGEFVKAAKKSFGEISFENSDTINGKISQSNGFK